LTAADVDQLTKSTRESMLKTLLEMSAKNGTEVDSSLANGTSTAIEI
jgi:lysophosphatidate acyltransferase